jgi:hypothetical protein
LIVSFTDEMDYEIPWKTRGGKHGSGSMPMPLESSAIQRLDGGSWCVSRLTQVPSSFSDDAEKYTRRIALVSHL